MALKQCVTCGETKEEDGELVKAARVYSVPTGMKDTKIST
jgi:hypothetical protein